MGTSARSDSAVRPDQLTQRYERPAGGFISLGNVSCAAKLAQRVAESLSRSVRANIEASVVLLRDELLCLRVEDESP